MKKSIAELIAEAAEAAKAAPEHLQEIAFSKAFEALSEDGAEKSTRPGAQTSRSERSSGGGQHREKLKGLDALDRTRHPEIHHSDTALDNALRLLRAARSDLQIDGLTAAEIARTLTEKFRSKVTRQAVGKALNDAGSLVNRHKEGSSVVFRIMAPGEEHLDNPSATQAPSGGSRSATSEKRTRSKKKTRAKKKVDASSTPSNRGERSGKSKARSGSGSFALLRVLFNNGFFKSPRTIGVITTEMKDAHGRSFKSSEISPALLRYLRNDDLRRDKNSDGQYEYTEN